LDGHQHGIDAILYVQVGLTLLAIAQYLDLPRIVTELAIKIEHVSMRVALAENGDEAENAALDSKARSVGGDQSFAGQVRGAVKACLNWKWCILRGGKNPWLPVNGTRRGEGQAADAINSHRFEYMKGC